MRGYTGAMKRLPLILLLSTLAACTGARGDDTSGSSGSSGTDSSHDTSDTNPGVAPSIVSIDTVECTEFQSAGESWTLALTVDDPQGPTTVNDGSVTVLQNRQSGNDRACVCAQQLWCDASTPARQTVCRSRTRCGCHR